MVKRILLVGLLALAGGTGCEKETDSYNPHLSVSSRLDYGATGVVGEPYEVRIYLEVQIEEAEDSNRTEMLAISHEDVVATCTAGCTLENWGESGEGIALGVLAHEPGDHELHVEVHKGAEDVYEATLPLRFAAVDSLTVMYDSYRGPGTTQTVLPGTRVEWCARLLSVDGDELLLPPVPRTPLLAGFGEATQEFGECRTLIPDAPGTTTFTASYKDLYASHDLHVASAETAQDVVLWQVPDTEKDWIPVDQNPLVGARRVDRIDLEVGKWMNLASEWILADGTSVLGGAVDVVAYPDAVVRKSFWLEDSQPEDVRWFFGLQGVAPGNATLSLYKGDISLALPIVVREAAP